VRLYPFSHALEASECFAQQRHGLTSEQLRFVGEATMLPGPISLAFLAPLLSPRETDTPTSRELPALGISVESVCSWLSSAGLRSSSALGP